MGFNLIVPLPVAKSGVFKISTIQMRSVAPWRLQISIPAPIFTILFKDAETFDLLLGEGADKGKLLMRPAADGLFKPTFLKHTVIFRLPPTDWTPKIALSCEDPERRQAADGAVTVVLPAWLEDGRWQEIAKARSQVSLERETEKQRGGR